MILVKLAERPGLLAWIVATSAALGGIAAIRVTTATMDHTARVQKVPPAHLQCGHAVSEWLRENGEDD